MDIIGNNPNTARLRDALAPYIHYRPELILIKKADFVKAAEGARLFSTDKKIGMTYVAAICDGDEVRKIFTFRAMAPNMIRAMVAGCWPSITHLGYVNTDKIKNSAFVRYGLQQP